MHYLEMTIQLVDFFILTSNKIQNANTTENICVDCVEPTHHQNIIKKIFKSKSMTKNALSCDGR
jgi:hypothetical protein